MQRADDRVRLTLRLVNVGDGAQLWSGVFEDKSTNRFALEDSITAQITRSLALKLTGAEQTNLSKRPTTNIEAYELYLRGRYFWNKREHINLQNDARLKDLLLRAKLTPATS